MMINEIVDLACIQGLVNPKPNPRTMTIMLVDDDGCIVSLSVTHEFIEDYFGTEILTDQFALMMLKR